MVPKEQVSLDIQREAETPDRPAAARVHAILPRSIEVLAVEQLDHRLLPGHLALVGQVRRGARKRHMYSNFSIGIVSVLKPDERVTVVGRPVEWSQGPGYNALPRSTTDSNTKVNSILGLMCRAVGSLISMSSAKNLASCALFP